MAKGKDIAGSTSPFIGFTPATLRFFEDLAANQDREWFNANKGVYEQAVREPLSALVEALNFAFAAHDVPLAGDPKRSLFRIHRDVRFSKDKRPYKTNAGAVLSRGGVRSTDGMVYIHIAANDQAFMAAGFYGQTPEKLTALRQAIARDQARWLKVEASLAKGGLSVSREGARVRLPRGFEAQVDTPVAEALKLPHLIVRRPIPEETLFGPGLIDDICDLGLTGLPLLEFGWSALERVRPG